MEVRDQVRSYTEDEVCALLEWAAPMEGSEARSLLAKYAEAMEQLGTPVGYESVVVVDLVSPPETNYTAELRTLRELRTLVKEGVTLDEAKLNSLIATAKGLVMP